MLEIKNEYIDCKINCPARNIPIDVRMIPRDLYNYYYSNGYSFIFKIIPNKKNDISK